MDISDNGVTDETAELLEEAGFDGFGELGCKFGVWGLAKLC